jgi:flagellar basal-body rod modification protein FlgD
MQVEPTAATTGATAPNSKIGLADSFDGFLKLLTTQLKNQDPLSPMDANQFTEQLVQFTAVEQAIKTNESIGQLVALMKGQEIARSLDYLGTEIEAGGDTIRLGAAGDVDVQYRLDQSAAEVAISIYDGAGSLVSQGSGPTGVGSHRQSWDGRDLNGSRLPEGFYRVEIAATDASGQELPVSNRIGGLVDGVEMSGERLLLSVGGVLVPLDSVTAIRRPDPA